MDNAKDQYQTPWENRAKLGLFRALFRTIKDVLFSPDKFFKNLVKIDDCSDAFRFYLYILIMETVIGLLVFWGAKGFTYIFSTINPVLVVFVSIIFFVLQLVGIYVAAFALHIFVRLVGGQGGYARTFNVVAYSSFVYLFYILGSSVIDIFSLSRLMRIIFQFIFSLCMLFAIVRIFIVAYGRFHKLSIVKSFVALLLPFLLVGALQFFIGKFDTRVKSRRAITTEDSFERLQQSMISASEAEAKVYILTLKNALKLYQEVKGEYPTTISELSAYLTPEALNKLMKTSPQDGYSFEYKRTDGSHFQVYAKPVETKVPGGKTLFLDEKFSIKIDGPEGDLLERPAKKEDMLQQLNSADSFKRASAARWLGENKVVEAVKPLIKCLYDSKSTLGDASYNLDDCKEALVKIGSPAIEDLLSSLENDKEKNIVGIVEVLGEIKDVRAAPALAGLLSQSDAALTTIILRALKKVRAPETSAAIIPLLKSEDANVRAEAAAALGGVADEQAVKPLIEALNDSDYRVKSNAGTSLVAIGEPAVEALIASLRGDASSFQQQIDEIIPQIGSVSVKHLIAALSNEDKYIVIRAAFLLTIIGDANSKEPVINLFNHKEFLVRVEVAKNILRYNKAWDITVLRTHVAIEGLIAALDSPQVYVQTQAMQALGQITGANYGVNKSDWETWWAQNKEKF